MDQYWEELEANLRLRPPEDDFSHYFAEYKNFDSLFNEALTTLQDLDVPSGYPVPLGSQTPSPFRHAKKASGTAIFGFADHTRELSLTGSESYKMRPPEPVRSISPAQLARRLAYPVTDDQLDLNFSQDDKKDDLIVNKAYKFPPDRDEDFLGMPIAPIRHPRQTQRYPAEIDVDGKPKKYVPIPVAEPQRCENTCESLRGDDLGTRAAHNPPQTPILGAAETLQAQNIGSLTLSTQTLQSEPLSGQTVAPALQHIQSPTHSANSPHSRRHSPLQTVPEALLGLDLPPSISPHLVRLKELNMNVFLPPPSDSDHSPLPHAYALNDKRFYNPQFFSDELYLELEYLPQTSLRSSPLKYDGSSPARYDSSSPLKYDDNSSPLKYDSSSPVKYDSSSPVKYDTHSPGKYDSFDDTVDANETILQLTPLKATPNKVTLEWSPIISPKAGSAAQVRRTIKEISPRRTTKKTSLLPPGELDQYWEGPDENKVFTCTYKNCGKKFTRRYNVRSHIQTHLSDRPFTCHYCPKNFVRQHDLNRHIKSHQVTKHCRCTCGKEFTRVDVYRKHLANEICTRNDGVLKPKPKTAVVLDSLTSNRLSEDLGL